MKNGKLEKSIIIKNALRERTINEIATENNITPKMAKAHKLNPFVYFYYVLTDRFDDIPSDNDLALLAPWIDLVHEHCKS